APHLTFGGLQAYHGSAQHLRGWDERRQAITQAADKAGQTRDLLARHGIECPTITGAGTGTFEFETASGVYTELQCGSYIFMDADYGKNRDREGAPTKAFEPRLLGWGTGVRLSGEGRYNVADVLEELVVRLGPALRTSLRQPMSAPLTSTAGSPSRPPPTGSGLATRSG